MTLRVLGHALLGKRSTPRNLLLFGILYRMKLVEHVSSGIKRISEALAADGLQPPVLDIDDNWFSISFIRRTEMSSQKSAQKICALMHEQSDITIKEFAAEIGISNRATKNHLSALQNEGKIKRV